MALTPSSTRKNLQNAGAFCRSIGRDYRFLYWIYWACTLSTAATLPSAWQTPQDSPKNAVFR